MEQTEPFIERTARVRALRLAQAAKRPTPAKRDPVLYRLDTVISRGTHSGKTVEAILDEDPGYVRYIVEEWHDVEFAPEVEDRLALVTESAARPARLGSRLSMVAIGDIGPWSPGIDARERSARCRELRALATVYLGRSHPLTAALAIAATDDAALDAARIELAAIPALSRRRLLASYMSLLPTRRRSSVGARA